MSVEAKKIDAKLRGAWDRECWFYHLRGVGFLVPSLIGIFLIDLLIDWLFDLPGALRFVLLLTNLGVLGWIGWKWWISHLRSYDATRVSLQVERVHPELNNLLVSFVQLDTNSKKTHGSRRMIEVVRAQAAKLAATLDFSGIVNFMKLRNLMIVAASVLVLFLASSVFAYEYYLILAGRLLNPFTSLAYPTRTQIEEVVVVRTNPAGTDEKIYMKPGAEPVAVKQGDKIEIRAAVGGEIPEQGSLFVRFANASWEEILLEPSEGKFVQKFPKVTQSFTYYYRIGDARRTPYYEAKVVAPPRLTSSKMKLSFPSYTGREPKEKEFKGLQVEAVPEGTEVTWELHCDQPLQKGFINFGGEAGHAVPLQIDPEDNHRAFLQMGDFSKMLPDNIRRSGIVNLSYNFEWTEANHGFTFTDATRYSLEILLDKPPVVTLIKPHVGSADKILATTQKNLHVIFEVSDDYGLGKAWINYRLNGEQQARRLPIGAFPPGSKSDMFQMQWLVKDALPDLKEGDILTCQIEASDNRGGDAGPNISQSPTFRLHIVSDTEYLKYVDGQFVQGLDRTTSAAKEEVLSSKRVKSLITEK